MRNDIESNCSTATYGVANIKDLNKLEHILTFHKHVQLKKLFLSQYTNVTFLRFFHCFYHSFNVQVEWMNNCVIPM